MKICVEKSAYIGKYAVLTLNHNIPKKKFDTYLIENKMYKPISYHYYRCNPSVALNVIAIEGNGEFVGKEVLFVCREKICNI